MNEEQLYLNYLVKQIAITKNWIGRLEKKIWFLETSFKLEKDKLNFERTHKPTPIQTDLFAG